MKQERYSWCFALGEPRRARLRASNSGRDTQPRLPAVTVGELVEVRQLLVPALVHEFPDPRQGAAPGEREVAAQEEN